MPFELDEQIEELAITAHALVPLVMDYIRTWSAATAPCTSANCCGGRRNGQSALR